MQKKFYTIDFETVSTQDLKEVGIRNYVHHPETQVALVAITQEGEKAGACAAFPWVEAAYDEQKWDYLAATLLKDLADPNVRVTCIAHNAVFEEQVFKKLGWPQPYAWVDSMVEAYKAQCPGGLAAAAKALGCTRKLTETKPLLRKAMRFKTEEPKRKNSTCCKVPFHWAQTADGLWYASGVEFYSMLSNYCLHDVYAAEEVSDAALKEVVVRSYQFPEGDEPGTNTTKAINNRGIRIDTRRLETMQKVLDYMETHARAFAQNELGIDSLQQKSKALQYFREHGLELDGVGQEDITIALQKQSKHPLAGKLRRYSELNRSSLYKLNTLSKLVHKGRLYDTLKYCGAYITGRWSGSGFQVQNLPRPTHSREEVEAFIKEAEKRPQAVLEEGGVDKLVSAIRTLIIPDEGEVLVSIDLSQIELRLSAYTSKSPDYALLSEGKDSYSAFATEVYGYPVRKGMPERNVGKEAVLSLQYGSGAKTLQRRLLAAHHIPVNLSFCKQIVETFRTRNKHLVEMWNEQEQKISDCYYRGDPLSIELASGRILSYGNITAKETRSPLGKLVGFDYGYSDGRATRKLWGGIVYQNKIQAEARDIFLLKLCCFKKEVPIMLVHDEAVFSCKTEDAPRLKERWEAAANDTIEALWPGLKLESEAEVTDRYFK